MKKFEPGSAPDAEGHPARSVEALSYSSSRSVTQVTFLLSSGDAICDLWLHNAIDSGIT
jgi:hypothetical protein